MNHCPKCSNEMRQYIGLKVIEWYCDNQDCGKDTVTTTAVLADGSVGILTEELKKSFREYLDRIDADIKWNVAKLKPVVVSVPVPQQANYYSIERFDLEEYQRQLSQSYQELWNSFSLPSAVGQHLDNIAINLYGIERHGDETDEAFRFRIQAHLED